MENWLTDKGTFKKRDIVSFSMGRRNCVGMGLAEKALSVDIALFMIRYQFSVKDTQVEIESKDFFTGAITTPVGLILTRRD